MYCLGSRYPSTPLSLSLSRSTWGPDTLGTLSLTLSRSTWSPDTLRHLALEGTWHPLKLVEEKLEALRCQQPLRYCGAGALQPADAYSARPGTGERETYQRAFPVLMWEVLR